MNYSKLAPLKIDEFELEVDSVTIVCEKNTVWPMGFDAVVTQEGIFFGNRETIFQEKDTLNFKIWVQLPDFNLTRISNIFNSIFSIEGENPSVRARSKQAKAVSYLVSKILKNSDFTKGDMRHPVLSDKNFTWARSATTFIIEKK